MSTSYQGHAEDFQIGVALRIATCVALKKFLSATPIWCGASKCWCGDKEINVVEVIRLIEVKEIAYLVEIMFVYTIVSNS